MQRNLVKNGGVLDGVIFVERTTDEADLALLTKMIDAEPAYERWHLDMEGKDNFAAGFGGSYDQIEDDVFYVKMDDDIVSSASILCRLLVRSCSLTLINLGLHRG